MFARSRPFFSTRLIVWQIAVCLAVVALLCRAVIPVGYMPGASQERERVFSVTFCSMGGTMSMPLDLSAGPAPLPDHEDAVEFCPYGLIAQHTLWATSSASIVLPFVAAPSRPAIRVARASISLHVAGPPLGSRAPPVQFA